MRSQSKYGRNEHTVSTENWLRRNGQFYQQKLDRSWNYTNEKLANDETKKPQWKKWEIENIWRNHVKWRCVHDCKQVCVSCFLIHVPCIALGPIKQRIVHIQYAYVLLCSLLLSFSLDSFRLIPVRVASSIRMFVSCALGVVWRWWWWWKKKHYTTNASLYCWRFIVTSKLLYL